MGVDAKHPLYTEFAPDWKQMRDTHRGQRAVKGAGFEYLSPTAGMLMDGAGTSTDSEGSKAYSAYRMRAVFPELVKQAVRAMIGVMHNKPPVIELPDAMEPMLENATLMNESLAMLLRRINEEQLITGRAGLLLEVPDGAGAQLPFITFYRAEDIINWDEGTDTDMEKDNLNLVSLDETALVRTIGDFEWETQRKYRILILGDVQANEAAGTGAVYRVGVFTDDTGATDARAGTADPASVSGATFNEDALMEPVIAGEKAEEIPFVFINTQDVVPTPEGPPLLGLSDASLTIYRGEADYRQALFMQGQDTLVVVGQVTEGTGSPNHRTGAGASIDLPMGGEAMYIGVDSTGLSEMRTGLENDYTRGGKQAGELLDDSSRQKESGEALKIRVSARTATLTQLAEAGAFGLQSILRKQARWMNLDPEEVVVTPNLDFVDDQMTGEDLTQLMGGKMLGAPISLETIHERMQEKGMTDRTFDEELEEIEKEKGMELGGAETTNPDGPADDASQGGSSGGSSGDSGSTNNTNDTGGQSNA